jgi:hypothetical protein
MRYDAEPKVINKSPSTAYRNKKGEYVPCPVNQPCYAERMGAQPMAPIQHPEPSLPNGTH